MNFIFLPGISLVLFISLFTFYVSQIEIISSLSINQYFFGIILGWMASIVLSNRPHMFFEKGVAFCSKSTLKLGIILYGFQINLVDIYDIGIKGIIVDIFMITSTLIIGIIIGIKLLKIDRETAIMTATGSAICGVAAIIATEPIVKAKGHQTSVAVGTVVIFGTISMFLYPLAYKSGLIPMDLSQFGIYIGATVHELAHVVGAGKAIGRETADVALIIKMFRVLMLVPALLIISIWLSIENYKNNLSLKQIQFPIFAICFLIVIVFNSFEFIPNVVVQQINYFVKFLFTMVMIALGFNIDLYKLKRIGLKVIYLSFIIFTWLVIAGFIATLSIT